MGDLETKFENMVASLTVDNGSDSFTMPTYFPKELWKLQDEDFLNDFLMELAGGFLSIIEEAIFAMAYEEKWRLAASFYEEFDLDEEMIVKEEECRNPLPSSPESFSQKKRSKSSKS